MSLCICKIAPNGNMLIAGDSRVCRYNESGIPERTGENIEKVRLLAKDKIVFMSGIKSTAEDIVRDFQRAGMSNPLDLANILQWHTEQIPDEVLEKRKDTMLHTAVLYVCLEAGQIKPYVVCNALKGKDGRCFPYCADLHADGKSFITIGGTKEVDIYFQEILNDVEKTEDLIKAICKTYDYACNEQVGGLLTIYEFSRVDGVIKKHTHQIMDKSEHLNVLGLNVSNNLLIDETGSVTVRNGSISSGVINGKNKINNRTSTAQSTPNSGKNIDARGLNIKDDNGNTVLYMDKTGIHWTQGNEPMKYQFSIDGVSWHDTMQSTDKYRRDSLDGGNTWGIAYQFKGTDGSDGSDANVPSYITQTKITQTEIESPTIRGGLIESPTIKGGKFSDLNEEAIYLDMESGGAAGTHVGQLNMHALGDDVLTLKSVYSNVTGEKTFEFKPYQTTILEYDAINDVTRAKGNWDFSEANTTGLTAVAVFG